MCTSNEAGRQLTSAELPARLEKSSVVEESISVSSCRLYSFMLPKAQSAMTFLLEHTTHSIDLTCIISDRFSHLQELARNGDRLKYKLLSGNGPQD